MPEMSIRAYARHRQINHTSVLKALRAGRIHREASGLIDSERADAQWSSNTDEAKPLNSISGDPKHRRAPDGVPRPTLGTRGENGGNGSNRVAGSYASARAAREVVELQIRRIELKRLEGKLIDADQVYRESFASARQARDAFLAIPNRISAILAGMDDQFAIYRLLTEEIGQVCDDLSERTATAFPPPGGENSENV